MVDEGAAVTEVKRMRLRWGDSLPSQPGLVPSVLIYGDLLRDGDARSLEIATNLRSNDAHLRTIG